MPFITIEGIEGCGKSTQAQRLVARLGPHALLTVEPGGTPLGRSIRELLLRHGGQISPVAELLLFYADRAQHVAEVIRPALAAGRSVVSDRYADSTLAYQGYGRGLSLDFVRALAVQATGGLTPDVTILLDVPVDVGLSRANRRRALDRIEGEQREFHERVRQGYRQLAREEPGRFLVIDAHADEATVAERVAAALAGRGIGGGGGVR